MYGKFADGMRPSAIGHGHRAIEERNTIQDEIPCVVVGARRNRQHR